MNKTRLLIALSLLFAYGFSSVKSNGTEQHLPWKSASACSVVRTIGAKIHIIPVPCVSTRSTLPTAIMKHLETGQLSVIGTSGRVPSEPRLGASGFPSPVSGQGGAQQASRGVSTSLVTHGAIGLSMGSAGNLSHTLFRSSGQVSSSSKGPSSGSASYKVALASQDSTLSSPKLSITTTSQAPSFTIFPAGHRSSTQQPSGWGFEMSQSTTAPSLQLESLMMTSVESTTTLNPIGAIASASAHALASHIQDIGPIIHSYIDFPSVEKEKAAIEDIDNLLPLAAVCMSGHRHPFF